MANVRRVQLAGAILLASAAMLSTNLAFGQTGNSFFPPCQVSDKAYHCDYLGLAQAIGATLVACIVAIAVGLGAYGRRFHAAAYA